MALPRNSFVQSVLEGGRSVARLLRITLATWWHRATTPAGAVWAATGRVAMAEDCTCRPPQPLTAVPELQHLRRHDAWLAHPAVRVQCMWDRVGAHGVRFRYYLASNGHLRTLAILLQERNLVYMRMHANRAFAAVDGTLWAGELRDQPVRRVFGTGGVDREGGGTWSVAVVQRERRYELHVTSGGLIPMTCDFRTLEEALLAAESWLTDFHHAHAAPAEQSVDEDEEDDQTVGTEWLM